MSPPAGLLTAVCLVSVRRREKSTGVDLAKKDGANGSYKAPSAVIAAGDAKSKVPAKPQPPKKKPVESVDLLGLNEKPPTPLAAPVVKAPSPTKPAPSPPKQAAAPVVKPASPPKPTQTSPPKPTQTSPPKLQEVKKSPKTSPKKPADTEAGGMMASAFTSVSVKAEDADNDDDNDNDNDDDNDNDGDDNDNGDNDGEDKPKEPKAAKKTTPTKKSKKKRKVRCYCRLLNLLRRREFHLTSLVVLGTAERKEVGTITIATSLISQPGLRRSLVATQMHGGSSLV
ncbi:unnamed protein product [Phytophthora fragariaefolia]|uniref:Unnamed protein product n=1 Tax=Phytophthora fragariaefolia TaxID=1490495 RepID=A0A9W6XQU5_9STRA|nr:unnamed protein product [Phytophthora fragariaefolia]